MTAVEIQGISKRLGTTLVLDGLDLRVDEGSITAILGRSGSGKTTLLRAIAGLERIEAGTIRLGGDVVDGPNGFVDAQRRGVGYVPQDGALFPHLSVAGNIGFGIRRSERARIDELLDLVDLRGYAHRYPGELSGGQQQRVALARALAIRPRLVLLDEPFSSLDASLRNDLRRDLKRILKDARTTAVLVTHDQGEALSMADEIALIANGRVVETGSPSGLYASPRTPAAARHIGEINALPGAVSNGVARCALGSLPVANGVAAGPTTVLVRPEQLVLTRQGAAESVAARVTELEYFGHDAVAHLRLEAAPEIRLTARVPWPEQVAPGQSVGVAVRGVALAE